MVLSISKPRSEPAAKNYLDRDDYHLREGEARSHGKGARELGLRGPLKREVFFRLLEGRHPKGHQLIAPGVNGNRKAGVDLTFSAPKSVSLLELVDERIRAAHGKAVKVALSYAEAHYAEARHTVGGDTRIVRTGNFVIALFDHFVSRELDPQLHSHAFVMNMTQREDGQWRALERGNQVRAGALYRNKLEIGQVYHNELVLELSRLGYAVEITDPKKGLFEIKGIGKDVIEDFSRRRLQVVEKVRELQDSGQYEGVNSGRLYEIAALGSRARKPGNIDRKTLIRSWQETLSGRGLDFEELKNRCLKERKEARGRDPDPKLSSADYVRSAADILTQTESHFTRAELIKTALKLALGQKGIRHIERAFQRLGNTGELVQLDSDEAITTRAMLDLESEIVEKVSTLQGQGRPVVDQERARVLAEKKYDDRQLTKGQREALELVLTTQDRVIGIQGDAGTGKTTLFKALDEIVRPHGYHLKGLAFTGKAARELTEKAGMESRTLHSFLQEAGTRQRTTQVHSTPTEPTRTIFIADEASTIDSPQMHRLITHAAETLGARILLVGDAKQLPPIGAGRMFQKLVEDDAVKTVHMRDNVRQRENPGYRQFVESLAACRDQRDVAAAIELLRETGKIRTREDHTSLTEKVVEDYLSRGDTLGTLIVTSRNEERREINEQIRNRLRNSRQLESREFTFRVREGRQVDGVSRHFPAAYSKGDLVSIVKSGAGLKRGVEGRVHEIDPDNHKITVDLGKGRFRDLDLQAHGDKVAIWEERDIGFSRGDKVVFLRNNRALGVQNGLMGTVAAVNARGDMTVETATGTRIAFNVENNFNYITHGHAITGYKAQGSDSDVVLALASTAGNVRQTYNSFYTMVTRGKKDFQVYTEDPAKLCEQVQVEQMKKSTLDYPGHARGEGGAHLPEHSVVTGWREPDKALAGREAEEIGRHHATPDFDEPWPNNHDSNEPRPPGALQGRIPGQGTGAAQREHDRLKESQMAGRKAEPEMEL